jgi:SAM-dependent methyltransferase
MPSDPRDRLMSILNQSLAADLAAGRPVKLNLGSGGTTKPGFYGVDHLALPGVDARADLNRPLDWLPDGSVDEVYSRHVFEHIPDVLGLMRELHRCVRTDARLTIIVPHFSNPYFYSDLTHSHPFGLYSFFYFCDPANQPKRKVPSFYVDFRFRVERIEIRFYKRSLLDKLVVPWLAKLVNSSVRTQDWYERRLCRLWHASELEFVLRPVKT